MTFSENNVPRKRHGFLLIKEYDHAIGQNMQRGQERHTMYTENTVNRYDYVICSNDAYGIIHHIPSKMIVKCSSELAETLRKGIEQEPVEEQAARYLAERFERNVQLDVSCVERTLMGIELFLSVWADEDTAYYNADTGSFDVQSDVMSKEVADSVISYLTEHFDRVENVAFFAEELQQEYELIRYICDRLEEKFSARPSYYLMGSLRSIPEEFLDDIEKYRIRICGNIKSIKGFSSCLENFANAGNPCYAITKCNFAKSEKVFCEAGLKMLAVDPNGEIYPCHAFAGQEGWLMGNILDHDWENRQRCRKVRAELQKITAGCVCRECTAREACLHCMATIELEWNGDFEKACRWKRRCNEYALLNFCKS